MLDFIKDLRLEQPILFYTAIVIIPLWCGWVVYLIILGSYTALIITIACFFIGLLLK
uniref:Uncharacterized protein n=1 Tax=viral metagenome TaxID=1070528 RepID=A0A6M3IYA8_9ZZZZ